MERMPDFWWERAREVGGEKKLPIKIDGKPHPERLELKELKRKKFENFLREEVDRKWNVAREREVKGGDILRIRRGLGKGVDKDDLPLARVKDRKLELPLPTVEGLAGLLEAFPQVDETGNIRYLLTSGLAVESITGFSREHHDTDLVICDASTGWWLRLITDNVTHKKYWADMSFEEGYLEATAWRAKFTAGGREYTILTVHPAILIVQKLSNAWGRPPREKDLMDVKALIGFWKKNGFDEGWLKILAVAIMALPNEKERKRTCQRFEELLRQVI